VPPIQSLGVEKMTEEDKRPLKLGVIGCGKVLERLHLPAIEKSSQWRLAAASDPSAGRRQWIEAKRPGVAVYDDPEKMLRECRPEGVLVASPPASHCKLAIKALESGAHVLLEKPMALDTMDAGRIASAVRDAGKMLWIGFNRRFKRPYLRLKAFVDSRLGGKIEGLEHELILDASGWQPYSKYLLDDAQGGGVIDDVISHQADLVPWICGSPPTQIRASATKTGKSVRVFFTMRHENGAETSCVAGQGPGYQEHAVVNMGSEVLFLFPTGLVRLKNPPSRRWYRYAALHGALHSVICRILGRPSLSVGSVRDQWEFFADEIRAPSGFTCGCSAEAGFRAVAVGEGCRRSLCSGGGWEAIETLEEASI